MSIREFKQNTEYVCSICGISIWNNQKITLEVDHIDGNNKNNVVENLRYLCPNCHSQTDTWRGRNKNSCEQKVSDDDLLIAIENTNNIRQALISVGLAPKGGNYSRVSNLMNKHKTDFKNSQYGTVWINDGTKNKKIKKELIEDYVSCGYAKGRLIEKLPPSQKGKIWVTNGIENKMVDTGNVPSGFWKGKFQKIK